MRARPIVRATTEGATVGPVLFVRDSTSQRVSSFMFTALNIVNGDVRSGAEKQEGLTKEGKDVMMGEEFWRSA